MSSSAARTRTKGISLGRCSIAAAALLCPVTTFAALKFSGWGGAQYEYNSNVFEVENLREAMEQQGTTEVEDSILRYKAGAEIGIEAGQQRLRAVAEGARVQYARFQEIDHDEHRLAGIFDWKLSSVVDGSVQYRHERALAPFADVDASILALQTQQVGLASFNVQASPRWRFETRAQGLQSELPINEDRTFELRESEAEVGLKYTTEDQLSAGVFVEGAQGEYRGALNREGNPTDADYDEWTLGLEGDYVLSGISTIHGEAGVVRREETPIFGERTSSTVTAFTGEVQYERIISDKTEATAEIFQRVSSYVAGANSLLETGLAAGIEWKATEKIGFVGKLGWSRADFQTGEDSDEGRKDKYLFSQAALSYQALTWLLMRAFGEYRERSSNAFDESFDAFVGGMELRAQFSE